MGLTLVEIKPTPKEELALKAIRNINGICYEQITAVEDKRRIETERVLNNYVANNAKYAIGDILRSRSKEFNEYMKVDRVEAKVHFGSHINITYYGKGMKKVKGVMRRTKDSNERIMPENDAELIQKA